MRRRRRETDYHPAMFWSRREDGRMSIVQHRVVGAVPGCQDEDEKGEGRQFLTDTKIDVVKSEHTLILEAKAA